MKENIGYIAFTGRNRQLADELAALITDVLCSSQASFRIGGSQINGQLVRERFAELQQPHIEYVLDCLEKNTTRIRNIRSYLLTTLYNAPTTMAQYYQAAVQHAPDCGRRRRTVCAQPGLPLRHGRSQFSL